MAMGWNRMEMEMGMEMNGIPCFFGTYCSPDSQSFQSMQVFLDLYK